MGGRGDVEEEMDEEERRVTECVLTLFLFCRRSMSAVAEEDNEERGRELPAC